MRKMLFVVFTNDGCKLNHAFLYANDLKEKGHEVKLILEGVATKAVNKLNEEGNEYFKKLFSEAQEKKIIAGACEKASNGCQDPSISVTEIMKNNNMSLLGDLRGHASISEYIDEGYEMIVF